MARMHDHGIAFTDESAPVSTSVKWISKGVKHFYAV